MMNRCFYNLENVNFIKVLSMTIYEKTAGREIYPRVYSTLLLSYIMPVKGHIQRNKLAFLVMLRKIKFYLILSNLTRNEKSIFLCAYTERNSVLKTTTFLNNYKLRKIVFKFDGVQICVKIFI